MRKALIAVLVVVAAAACSSSRGSGPAIRPEIEIVQTSGVPLVARHQQGAINVQFAVGVRNPSGENITLKRVRVVSVGEGPYHVNHSMSYDIPISPGQYQQVDFWAPGRTGLSLVGSAGPVTLRVTGEFESQSGVGFQEIVTRVVSENGVEGQ